MLKKIKIKMKMKRKRKNKDLNKTNLQNLLQIKKNKMIKNKINSNKSSRIQMITCQNYKNKLKSIDDIYI